MKMILLEIADFLLMLGTVGIVSMGAYLLYALAHLPLYFIKKDYRKNG
jgi:hypothetical protein